MCFATGSAPGATTIARWSTVGASRGGSTKPPSLPGAIQTPGRSLAHHAVARGVGEFCKSRERGKVLSFQGQKEAPCRNAKLGA